MKKQMMIGLLLLLVMLPAKGEARFPVLKSLLLPGWGEYSCRSESAYIFWGSETALWVGFAALRYSAHIQDRDIQSFSTLHAGISVYPESNQYGADLGNYSTYLRHRERMLENRTPEKIWNEDYSWEWDSESTREIYRNLYRKKELTLLSSEFMITGLIVNRIASMINVRYLKQKNLQVSAFALPSTGGGVLQFGLNF